MTAKRLALPARSVAFRHVLARRLSHTRRLHVASPRLEAELTAPNGTRWTQPLGLFIDNQFSASVSEDLITTVNPLYVYSDYP
jgi:aldehyde dehydrogenase (NAD(P)+)